MTFLKFLLNTKHSPESFGFASAEPKKSIPPLDIAEAAPTQADNPTMINQMATLLQSNVWAGEPEYLACELAAYGACGGIC